jgi:hypothetical protein
MAFANSLYGERDSIANIPNTLYGIIESDKSFYMGFRFTQLFYHKNDLLYFKGDVSNDTIWRISGLNTEPHAFINMGKYKLPWEYEPWASSFEAYFKICERYWLVLSVVEDDDYFYLFSIDRGYKQEKLIVYDKTKGKGFTAKAKYGRGLTDDILGGSSIWPQWSSDDYYINAIEAYELHEKVEAGEYTPSPPLKELLSRVGNDTNQLIILCHKKK